MNTSNRKVLSLGERAHKPINNQPGYAVTKPNNSYLTSVSSEDFGMDDSMGGYPKENRFNRVAPQYGGRNQQQPRQGYSKDHHQKDSFGSNNDGFGRGEDTNKIRRGPGRRLPKEKRFRNMDPAVMNKYATLSSSLQEKVNATIEIYYQQQMAKSYKGQLEEEADDADHYEEDVVYETEIGADEE